jgi:hypothetical protein
MSLIFDFGQFYNFYTDVNNKMIFTDTRTNRPLVYFYTRDVKTYAFIDVGKAMSTQYITSYGIKVFITKHGNGLLFSIPKLINGRFWDFHYHVGLNVAFKDLNDNVTKHMIFFHKTIQIPSKNEKEQKRCYFQDQLTITDVRNIVCKNNKQSKTMSQNFPFDHVKDIEIISDILTRPWTRVQTGGLTHAYEGKRYTIHIGKKGGRYILVKNRKKYVGS